METFVSVFNDVYERYSRSLISYFSKRFDTDDAEDMAQETFMKLWAYIPVWKGIENEKSFVFTVARNVLTDRIRQRKYFESLGELDNTEEISFDEDFGSIEAASLISLLDETDRTIVKMKTEGYNSREISEKIGISPSAVRTRLQGIRKMLEGNI